MEDKSIYEHRWTVYQTVTGHWLATPKGEWSDYPPMRFEAFDRAIAYAHNAAQNDLFDRAWRSLSEK